MLLAKKNILVTGGAKRVGAEIVRQLAQRGANLIIHCNTSHAEAAALLAELPHGDHKMIRADLAVPGEAEKLYIASGKPDLIVNNASFYYHSGIYDRETSEKLFRINLHSPLALMEQLVQNHPVEGAVVNVLDQAILGKTEQNNAYLDSRRELMESTLRFAKEYGKLALRFNAVCPGPMLPPAELPLSKMEKTIATLPLRRRVEPADLAKAVIFLLECDSVTGAVLPVDCGQHL